MTQNEINLEEIERRHVFPNRHGSPREVIHRLKIHEILGVKKMRYVIERDLRLISFSYHSEHQHADHAEHDENSCQPELDGDTHESASQRTHYTMAEANDGTQRCKAEGDGLLAEFRIRIQGTAKARQEKTP